MKQRLNRSQSPWIWRRFANSYRTQDPSGSNLWMYATTPSVGLGFPMLQGIQQNLLAPPSHIQGLTSTDPRVIGAGTTGIAGEIGMGNTGYGPPASPYGPWGIPTPGRKIAVKKVVGTIDVFPAALTLSLGDALYCHMAIDVVQSAGRPGSVTTLSPVPISVFDLEGRHFLWKRRYMWYFASFAVVSGNVAIQSFVQHVKVSLNFRKPIVLDMEDQLRFQIWADLQQGSNGITGIYNVSYLPYLSYLVKVF